MSQSFGVGTPPTSRRVSPAPRRRASGDQRNSVVPFTRPGSTGRLADSQNSSFERNFRPSVPTQSQSQPVVARPSFTKFSYEKQALHQGPSASSFSAPSNPVDSPFSRQEGFAASLSNDLVERGSQAVLASPPESPGRAKSTSLLSQQLNRESSLSLTPADVKVQDWSASLFLTGLRPLVYGQELTSWVCCRSVWRPAMICPLPYPPASKPPLVWRICR